MSGDVKTFLGIIGGTLLLVFGAAFLLGKGTDNNSGTNSKPEIAPAEVLLKPDSWSIGSPSAKVTIVEFSDFQCPACKAAYPTTKEVISQYEGKIRFVYRHFPIPSHEFGTLSAKAAEAAGLQMKFWEMHDRMFEKSPDLSQESLVAIAMELKLDPAKFMADLNSDATFQRVLNDQADGNKLGINLTPTFFINGTKFEGALSLEDFKKQIDSRLK